MKNWLVFGCLLFTACSKEDIGEPQWGPTQTTTTQTTTKSNTKTITMSLDGRLPIDKNGFYHLTLSSKTNQTTHRVLASVTNTTEPTKVEWESNLFWWFKRGEIVASITKTYINQFTGKITYVNLPPITNWQDVLVPTTNCCSYVDSNGEANTIIAPVYEMVGDTLVLTASIKAKGITKNIKIVLE